MMIYWPVVAVMALAPFGVWGWHWIDTQRLLAAHVREIEAVHRDDEELRQAAYGLGKRDGIADVRDQERAGLDATRAALAAAEAELATQRASQGPPPTPAEIVALCKASASCRERGGLK
jgi:hypothetical protein